MDPGSSGASPASSRVSARRRSVAGGGKRQSWRDDPEARHPAQCLGVAARTVSDRDDSRGAEPTQGRRQGRPGEQARCDAARTPSPAASSSRTDAEDLAPAGVDAGQHGALVAGLGAAAVRMSRLVAPITPMPRDWASALAAATPTRRPVNSPGPTSTATSPRSARDQVDLGQQVLQRGGHVSTWRRRPVSANSASTPAAVRTATPTVSVAVSMATVAPGDVPLDAAHARHSRRRRPGDGRQRRRHLVGPVAPAAVAHDRDGAEIGRSDEVAERPA